MSTILIDLMGKKSFMAILAASNTALFSAFFKPWDAHYDYFEAANSRIASGLVKHFPPLSEGQDAADLLDLGKVMGILIKNSQLTNDTTPSQVAIDQDVLLALTLSWKGLSTEGAELVIKEFQRFEDRYKSRAHVRYLSPALLIDGFPTHADYIIRAWEKENEPDTDTDATELIKRFLVEVWPKVFAVAAKRQERHYEVSEKVKIRFDGIISKSKCARDFYDVLTPADKIGIHAIAGAPAGGPTEKNKIYIADEYMLAVKKYVAANPHLCPNCFQKHRLRM